MALYERMAPPRWKPVRNFPGYEISEEGQVRTVPIPPSVPASRETVAQHEINTGHIKKRFWRYSKGRTLERTYVPEHEWEHKKTHSSLFVRLHRPDGKRVDVKVSKLMDRHWPNAEYPEWWTATNSTVSAFPEDDNRRVLTNEERVDIIKSSGSVTDLAEEYGVARSTISRIRNGNESFSRQYLEDHPELKRREHGEE